MDHKWLEDFIALARERSFSRAAEQRHVTQPQCSRRIRALELWVGADLVNRAGMPLALTAAGEELLPVARRAVVSLTDTRARIRHAQGGLDWVTLATGRTLSFKQFENGTVLIGGGLRGTAWPERNETKLDLGLLAVNAQTVAVLFPHMRGVQVVRAWAGIEARLPDDIPVIGASSTHDGAWHAFGFSAHGFQLGPIVGSIMANLVTGRGTRFDLRPFAVTRFGAPGVTPATS